MSTTHLHACTTLLANWAAATAAQRAEPAPLVVGQIGPFTGNPVPRRAATAFRAAGGVRPGQCPGWHRRAARQPVPAG